MIRCPHCDRAPVAEPGSLYQHIKAKHGRQKAREFWPQLQRMRREEREDSIADLQIEALLDAAMGEAIADDIATMFADDFDEVRRRREEVLR